MDIVASAPAALESDPAFDRHLALYARHGSLLTGHVAGAKRRVFLAESPLPASLRSA